MGQSDMNMQRSNESSRDSRSSLLTQIEKAGVQRGWKIGSNGVHTPELCHKRIVVIQVTVIICRARHVCNTADGSVDLQVSWRRQGEALYFGLELHLLRGARQGMETVNTCAYFVQIGGILAKVHL